MPKCFSKLGLHERAINDIKELIANKSSIDNYFDLGEIYFNASLLKEAKETFLQVVNFFPDTDNEMYKKMVEDMNRPIKDKARVFLQKLN